MLNENKLFELFEGYFCDIWENMIMFGVVFGLMIGILYSEICGFVGFFVILNIFL